MLVIVAAIVLSVIAGIVVLFGCGMLIYHYTVINNKYKQYKG